MEGMNISNLGHPRGLIQVGEEKGEEAFITLTED